jgi:hypothetical protein
LCETIGNDPAASINLPSDIAAALPALVQDARAALAPADDREIIGKCIEICAGIGMGAGQKEKSEWQAWACIQLAKLPRALMLEGLDHASTTCERLNQVVKEVFAYAENYPSRLRQQLSRLEALEDRAKQGEST